ncbi:MAG: hypothetical protein HQL67_12435 [Magnetococcales bacterium]|nr:hypothetical protein [Magnetococcales bacterium]
MKMAHQKHNNINSFMAAEILDGQMEMAAINILKTNDFLDGHFLPPKGGDGRFGRPLPKGVSWGRMKGRQMDEIHNLLDAVKSQGLSLIVDGDNLLLKGVKGSASTTLVAAIKKHKDELITRLTTLEADIEPGTTENTSCYICQGIKYWRRPTWAGWNCCRCHPPIPGIEIEWRSTDREQ